MVQILKSYPAFDFIAYEGQELADGTEFVVPFPSARFGEIENHFKLGSVEGYYRSSRDATEESVQAGIQRSISLGHELYYAFGTGAMITSHKRAKETKILLRFGDEIKFAGKTFRIEKAPNNNVKLVEV